MPKAAPPRPVPTFDHLRKKQPLERTVRIVLNDEAAGVYQDAAAALRSAETALADAKRQAQLHPFAAGPETEAAVATARTERDEAKATAEKARRALDAETIELRFRSIGRRRYDELVLAHPPKETAGNDGKPAKGADPFDFDTFSVALVAASCVEPVMTVEEVSVLFDEWNSAEIAELWTAALVVNTQRRVVELGKASNGMRG